MTIIASLGLGLSLTAAGPTAATHTASVEHRSGPVQAQYRASTVVEHKQIGSVAPPGRSGTLRCAWTARLSVDRTATTAFGALVSRSFAISDVAGGSRPGWCRDNRRAIAHDVATRLGDTDRYLAAAAREDREVLLAEVDRLAAPA